MTSVLHAFRQILRGIFALIRRNEPVVRTILSVTDDSNPVDTTPLSPMEIERARTSLSLDSSQTKAFGEAFRTILARYPELTSYKPLIEAGQYMAFFQRLTTENRISIEQRFEIKNIVLEALDDATRSRNPKGTREKKDAKMDVS